MATDALRKSIFGGADKIGTIDLQNQTHWGHTCCYSRCGHPQRCERCDCARDYKASLNGGHILEDRGPNGWVYPTFYKMMLEIATPLGYKIENKTAFLISRGLENDLLGSL